MITKKIPFAGSRALDMLEEDYEVGEITIVYGRRWDGRNEERYLIVATVELLTKWHEKSPALADPKAHKLPGRGTHEINVHRFHMAPQEALAWYQKLADGLCTVTIAGKVFSIGVPPLVEEPRYPDLIAESDEHNWSLLYCFGDRPGGERWHHYRSSEPEAIAAKWPGNQKIVALNSIKDAINIDLSTRPALIGSAHLLVPNPIFHEIGIRGTENECGIILTITPFPGKDITKLSAIITREQPAGIISVDHVDELNNYNYFEWPSPIYKSSIAILCPIRGVLYVSPSAGFLRSINMQIELITAQRTVQISSKKNIGTTGSYTVPVRTTTTSTLIGDVDEAKTGTQNVANELHLLESISLEKKYDQFWFGRKDEKRAEEIIRDIIKKANNSIMIVDPYFGVAELARYALAASNAAIPVKILTSNSFLKTKYISSANEEKTQLQLLLNVLADLPKDAVMNSIEIRVMAGAKPEIHDRFISSDGKIWVLGSSLNEFGSRGTIMVQLPHPGPIDEKLNEVWDKAIELKNCEIKEKA